MLLASKHFTAPGPMRIRLTPLWLLALLSGGAPALAAQSAQDTPGFLEGASLEVLSRNFYLNNDYRSPTPAGKSYKQEWAQGFIASFASGFTPGTLGVGVDAHGFLGLKLDGGKGHSGTGLLPLDHDGRSEDSYSSAGGALKFKASRTTLALGEMTVATPVFDTADKRLQPEYASGLLLSSRELEGLDLQAGHFNAFKNQDASTTKGDFSGYGATTRHASIDFIGADLFAGQALGGALYASELSDTWRQYYANLHASLGQWFLDGNLYRTRDQGQAAAGAIDTTAYSLAGKYRIDAQAFTLAYQKIHGERLGLRSHQHRPVGQVGLAEQQAIFPAFDIAARAQQVDHRKSGHQQNAGTWRGVAGVSRATARHLPGATDVSQPGSKARPDKEHEGVEGHRQAANIGRCRRRDSSDQPGNTDGHSRDIDDAGCQQQGNALFACTSPGAATQSPMVATRLAGSGSVFVVIRYRPDDLPTASCTCPA
ncbi:Outer membrane low permeability porin OccD7/OpdB proline [Pseudomonas chlororaphis]|uniref:Outer membrane low permeability porin OccD7/OpdB proline n=1 Tax=Pseudomonas chlororaphis TaxID=587753 RepID=A0A3G7TQR6_9PSED|nr:OprD family outer membrane porin [Pseudomonas chlororaphis]AZE49453.1 Outer membrane low permeability porin OccD7/OpdB proline [Pseudomonas chlororaphis]